MFSVDVFSTAWITACPFSNLSLLFTKLHFYQKIGTSKGWLSIELLNTQQLWRGIILLKLYSNLRKMRCYFANLRMETEAKKSYDWSFILRSLSYYKVYHDCGATVSFMLTRTHHRRWPLVKGGLKIPCNVSVTEPGTCLNLLSLKRYKQLSEKLHIEAKKVTLLVSFLTPVQEPERQNTKILYSLYKKSIVYWIPTWSYSIFPGF